MRQPTLTDYINSSSSLIWLDTSEYDRVMEELLPVAFATADKPVTVFAWRPDVSDCVTYADTLMPAKAKTTPAASVHTKLRSGTMKSLASWLTEVGMYAAPALSKQPVALVIYNPDLAGLEYADSNRKEDSSLYPILAETAKKFRFSNSFIFMVGPSCYMPLEYQELMSHVRVPLPSHTELCTFMKGHIDFWVKAKQLKMKGTKEQQARVIEDAANAARGMGYLGAEAALALSVAMYSDIDIPTIFQTKVSRVASSALLDIVDASESVDTLAGFSTYKMWLNKRRDMYSTKAQQFKLPNAKGVLFVGLPGTGKSTAAKVTASFLNLPLVYLDIGKLFQKYLGETEAAWREVVTTLDAISPCCLWIDEIEKGLHSATTDNDGGVSKRLMGNIMHWRQESQSPVFLVATANDVSALPPALYRKGRFDGVFAVDLPDDSTRLAILQIHLRKCGRSLSFTPKQAKEIIQASKGFSGSELQSAVSDGLFEAFSLGRDLIVDDIITAIKATHPLLTENSQAVTQYRSWVSDNCIPSV